MYVKYCSICLEKITKCGNNIILKECNHTFHKKCLEKWLIQNNNCPNCRVILSVPKKCEYLNKKCSELTNFKCKNNNFCYNINIKNFFNEIGCKKILSLFLYIVLLILSIFLLITILIFIPMIVGIIIILLINIFIDIKIKTMDLYIIYLIGLGNILIMSLCCSYWYYKDNYRKRRVIQVSI